MSDAEVEVRQPSRGLMAMLDPYRGRFAVEGPQGYPVDLFYARAQTYLEQRPDLAKCRPETVLVGLLECRKLGLELGSEYHLVPFKDIATGIVDYKGEVKLIGNAGGTVYADIVYADDTLSTDQGRLVHTRDLKVDRGGPVGAYAYAILRDGRSSRVVYMDADQIQKHIDLSRNPDAQKWWESWWLKTVVHELAKWVPWSAERAG